MIFNYFNTFTLNYVIQDFSCFKIVWSFMMIYRIYLKYTVLVFSVLFFVFQFVFTCDSDVSHNLDSVFLVVVSTKSYKMFCIYFRRKLFAYVSVSSSIGSTLIRRMLWVCDAYKNKNNNNIITSHYVRFFSYAHVCYCVSINLCIYNMYSFFLLYFYMLHI